MLELLPPKTAETSAKDWGSMIGAIKMGDAEFLSDVWRSPLDPNWGKEPWTLKKVQFKIQGPYEL